MCHVRRETRAGTNFEALEAPDAFFPAQRFSSFVQDHDLVAADHETPVAAMAVVESGFAWKKIAVAKRSDYELVSRVVVVPL